MWPRDRERERERERERAKNHFFGKRQFFRSKVTSFELSKASRKQTHLLKKVQRTKNHT